MDFFTTVSNRRSIRKFKEQAVPAEFIEKALQAAILAPNSSNTQTWDFHWIESKEYKQKMIPICLDQSAARTASHFVVISANPKNWQRSQKELIRWVEECKAPKPVVTYYQKFVPLMYRWGLFNSLGFVKFLIFSVLGLFKPVMRSPFTYNQIKAVCIKSAALAAENFVLAMTAQGAATCMMEGFDECRLKKLLKMRWHSQVLMVIAVGFEGERATWGPQFRLPLARVLTRY